ncbi:MAG: DUF945 family protein [Pseudomonadota bacterium]
MLKRLFKTLLFLFIGLLPVLLLALPGGLGWLIEHQLQKVEITPQSVSPGFGLSKTQHQRGWFSSQVNYRIWETDPDTGSLLYETTLDGTLHHGPWFWSPPGPGWLRFSGNLDYRNQSLREPITTSGQVGVGWIGTLIAKLDANAQRVALYPQGALNLGNGNLQLDYDLRAKSLAIGLLLGDLNISGQEFATDQANLEVDVHRNQHNLWIGSLNLNTAPVTLNAESFASTDLQLTITGKDSTIDYLLSLSLGNEDAMYGPGHMEIGLQGLDGEALRQILVLNAEARDAVDPELAQQNLLPQLMQQLAPLIQHGPKMSSQPFEINTSLGVVRGNLDFSVPPTQGVGLAGLIVGEGEARLVVPTPLSTHWRRNSLFTTMWRSLLNANFVVQQGNNYEMGIRYQDRQLNINGRPYPLPFTP